jgi:ADP-ribose pyrophosphatase YjhB (NUDIX family)
MRQVDKHGSAWSILGGKVDWRDDPRIPQVTAAREVQEETHDLVEAASLRPLLDGAPQPYYASGRYICYLVRLEDAQQLPAYYNQRVNGEQGWVDGG